MFVLHGLQGVAVLILSTNFSLPVIGNYLTYNQNTQSLEPASKVIFHLSLPWLVAIFFFLSSLFHLAIGTFYNNRYNQNLKNGMNKARWYEYSLSASVMMVAIAMLVGIYDAMSLLMIFALIAVMNLTGLAMEVYNQGKEKVNWLAYWLGTFAGIFPWLAVAFYLWYSSHNGSSAPTFVYYIFVSIFIFFSCFALNMWLQYKKIGKWKEYLYGERTYIILSLVAKSLLAWQVFAGTLRP